MRPVEHLARWPLHPFLLATYPVLFLYSRNLDEARAGDLVRPLGICLAATVIVFLGLRAWLRSTQRAAVVTSIAVIAIFAYGHVVAPLRGFEIGGMVVGRGLFMMPVWSLAALTLMLCAARARRDVSSLTNGLNAIALLLVFLSIAQAFVPGARSDRNAATSWTRFANHSALNLARGLAKEQHPDIYFIVLDEYARDDVLSGVFGYDNSGFLKFLESRGFYVARGSHSNYTFTYTSLASSLNLDYLPELARQCAAGDITKPLLAQMIEDNLLALTLKKAGYHFYTLPSEFYVTNRNRNADRSFRRVAEGMNEFERVLLSTTMLRPLMGGPRNHRLNRLYKFRTLPEVARLPGPKLVFAHIIMPHLPYVFDRDGNPPRHRALEKSAYTVDEYRELYIGQVHYLNKRMREVVDGILQVSPSPPIIIIQGDHGFRHHIIQPGSKPEQLAPEERSAILNAMYLPGSGREDVYPTISSVNTFRLVLSRYLGADLPLLPDETYVASYRKGVYRLTRVARWGKEEPLPAESEAKR
ncbi:MAG: hypothetical protein ACUVSM_01355 [Armatimonadota bacterium]